MAPCGPNAARMRPIACQLRLVQEKLLSLKPLSFQNMVIKFALKGHLEQGKKISCSPLLVFEFDMPEVRIIQRKATSCSCYFSQKKGKEKQEAKKMTNQQRQRIMFFSAKS